MICEIRANGMEIIHKRYRNAIEEIITILSKQKKYFV